MSGLCFVVAGLVFLVWSGIRYDRHQFFELSQWKSALLIALIMLLGGQGTRAIGELSLSSGTTSILFAIVPLFAIIINYVWLGQRLPKKVFMLLVFGLAGVILLVLTIWNEGNESFRSSLFLLFGTFLWALGSIYMRQKNHSSPLISSLGKQMFLGGWLLTAAGVFIGELNYLDPGQVTFESGMGMLYMILIGSLVGFPIFVWLLRKTSEFVANSFAFVSPIVALILGSATLNEPFSLQSVIATGMILSSVIMILTFTWVPKTR